MNTEKILVPFGRGNSDLKSLYHAFSLAERIKAKVVVLSFKEEKFSQEQITPLENALLEMAQSASEGGIPVLFHIASRRLEAELINIIKSEDIALIVIDGGDTEMASILTSLKLGASVQIIKVKGKKNNSN